MISCSLKTGLLDLILSLTKDSEFSILSPCPLTTPQSCGFSLNSASSISTPTFSEDCLSLNVRMSYSIQKVKKSASGCHRPGS